MFSAQTLGLGVPSSTSSTNERARSSTQGCYTGPRGFGEVGRFYEWGGPSRSPTPLQPNPVLDMLDSMGRGVTR